MQYVGAYAKYPDKERAINLPISGNVLVGQLLIYFVTLHLFVGERTICEQIYKYSCQCGIIFDSVSNGLKNTKSFS